MFGNNSSTTMTTTASSCRQTRTLLFFLFLLSLPSSLLVLGDPTGSPSLAPVNPTTPIPSFPPTNPPPTLKPTFGPTLEPTFVPTLSPTFSPPSRIPTPTPIDIGTPAPPTARPTLTLKPTFTLKPSTMSVSSSSPTSEPTLVTTDDTTTNASTPILSSESTATPTAMPTTEKLSSYTPTTTTPTTSKPSTELPTTVTETLSPTSLPTETELTAKPTLDEIPTDDTTPNATTPNATSPIPSSEPTATPTAIPTTEKPSYTPTTTTPTTSKPSTELPTTVTVTLSPTSLPTQTELTAKPTLDEILKPLVSTGLSMDIFGASFLNDNDVDVFENVTAQFILDFYNADENDNEETDDIVHAVTALLVVIEVTDQDPKQEEEEPMNNNNNRARQRQLQQQQLRALQETPLTLTYSQRTEYRLTNADDVQEDYTIEQIIEEPFLNLDRRNAFITALQADPRTDAFNNVSKVTGVQFPPLPDNDNNDGDDDDFPIGLVAGVAAGGGALVFVAALLGFTYYRKQKDANNTGAYVGISSKKKKDKKPVGFLALGGYNEGDMMGGSDEVSTLAEPQGKLGVVTSNESLEGYGEQSVPTVDYNYTDVYDGAGDTLVSSSGGTFGSNTQRGGGSSAADGTGTGTTGTAGGGIGGEAPFRKSPEGGEGTDGPDSKETEISIFAPPGKLGVVIDTPDEGAPVVHAIKGSSVIADKLRVGDKLIAVDGEDVRSMTAIKVSKLISRKSQNAQRKLTVIRNSTAN